MLRIIRLTHSVNVIGKAMSLASSRKASPRVHPSILPIHDAIPGVVLSSDSSPDSLMRIVSTPKGGFGTFDRMEPKSREFTLTSLVRLISNKSRRYLIFTHIHIIYVHIKYRRNYYSS